MMHKMRIYKVILRDGVHLIYRGRRKSKRGNTGVPMKGAGSSYSTDFAAAVCFVYLVLSPMMAVRLLRWTCSCCRGSSCCWAAATRTNTVTTGTKATASSVVAAELLLMYCCMLLLWLLD